MSRPNKSQNIRCRYFNADGSVKGFGCKRSPGYLHPQDEGWKNGRFWADDLNPLIPAYSASGGSRGRGRGRGGSGFGTSRPSGSNTTTASSWDLSSPAFTAPSSGSSNKADQDRVNDSSGWGDSSGSWGTSSSAWGDNSQSGKDKSSGWASSSGWADSKDPGWGQTTSSRWDDSKDSGWGTAASSGWDDNSLADKDKSSGLGDQSGGATNVLGWGSNSDNTRQTDSTFKSEWETDSNRVLSGWGNTSRRGETAKDGPTSLPPRVNTSDSHSDWNSTPTEQPPVTPSFADETWPSPRIPQSRSASISTVGRSRVAAHNPPAITDFTGKTQGELRRILLTLVSQAVVTQLTVIEAQNEDDRAKEVQKSVYYHRIDPASTAAASLKEMRARSSKRLIDKKRDYDKLLDKIVAVDARLRSFPQYNAKDVEAYTFKLGEYMQTLNYNFVNLTAPELPPERTLEGEEDTEDQANMNTRIKSVSQLKRRLEELEIILEELREDTEAERSGYDDMMEEVEARFASWYINKESRRNEGDTSEMGSLKHRVHLVSERVGAETKKLVGLIEQISTQDKMLKDVTSNLEELRSLKEEYEQALHENRQWIAQTNPVLGQLAGQYREIVSRPMMPPPQMEPMYEDLEPIVDGIMQAVIGEFVVISDGMKDNAMHEMKKVNEHVYAEVYRQVASALATSDSVGKWLQSNSSPASEQV